MVKTAKRRKNKRKENKEEEYKFDVILTVHRR